MVRENLMQNVSQDRGPCRINSVITGIFAEVVRNAKERIPPEGKKTSGGSVVKEAAGSEDWFCFLRLISHSTGETEYSDEKPLDRVSPSPICNHIMVYTNHVQTEAVELSKHGTSA
jgi:hypothetical protein